MSRTLDVSSSSVARILEDPRRRRLLLSLIEQERSLKEAADSNKLPLNLAHYHLNKLLSAELVEITRQQKRAGRPVRFYRARYSAYFIPAALLRTPPMEKLGRGLAAALESARHRSGVGVLLDVDDSGRARIREAAGSGRLPLEVWRRLNLSRRDAEALFEELTKSIHRYEHLGRGRSTWTIHLALAETPE